MPVLNDIRVGRALDSILSQKLDFTLELIVIDGGSNQSTLDEIELRKDRIDKFISEPDGGIYNAMNKGVALATGRIVGILNADDRYADTGVFERVVPAFDDDSVGACYSDMIYVDDDGKSSRRWKAGGSARYKWRLGWMPPHPTFFVRRELYKLHGSFKEVLSISADYEFMLRLAIKHNVKYEYIPTVTVHMTPGGNSARGFRTILRANLEVRRAWRMNGLRWGALVPLLKPARKLFQIQKSR